MVAFLVARVRESALSHLFISHCFEVNELTHILVVAIIEAASSGAAGL